MLKTTAATFIELRDKVLACRLCRGSGHSWTVSVVTRGREPAVFESFDQLPEPKEVKGVRKICAKLQVSTSI